MLPMCDSGHKPILTDNEVARRALLLRGLQTALTDIGMPCVLVRNHKLVLRWHSAGPFGPSGPTDPELHVFTSSGTTVATTDGTAYHFASGHDCPAADPDAAAALICDHAAASAAARH